MRILQEESEMKEKLHYKKKQQVGTLNWSKVTPPLDTKESKAVPKSSIHDIYKRVQAAHISAEGRSLKPSSSKPHSRSNDIMSTSIERRVNQALIAAHKAYRATDVQQSTINAWSKGDSGGKAYRETIGMSGSDTSPGLINYYSASPDMITMKDIPRYCVTFFTYA
jgi:hypothetical protein